MDKTTSPSSGAMAVATETAFGSHLLTIDGFTNTTAALAVGEFIRSERFLVGGHTWFIECYPRWQDKKGGAEWVSVTLWPDNPRALDDDEVKVIPMFVLLDRAGDTIKSCRFSHVETFSRDNGPTLGVPELIERKALESYLLIQDDDCCRIRCDVTVITRDPPPVDLHGRNNNLGDLLLASEVGKDVTFVVGGERFMAHSCVLAARTSSAFMAEVLAGKEGAGGSRHVRVDGVASWVFEALLRFIYTDSLSDEEEDDGHDDLYLRACDLMEVAHRYDMERLKMMCTDVLCSKIFPSTALLTLELSEKVGCLKLNQTCVAFIRNKLDGLDMERTNRWRQPGKGKLT